MTNQLRVPFLRQYNSRDCGIACLKMMLRFYGKNITMESLRTVAGFERTGTTMFGLAQAARRYGLEADGVLLPLSYIESKEYHPCILHWKENHYVILTKVKNNNFLITDPAKGRRIISREDFLSSCIVSISGQKGAHALILNKGANFDEIKNESEAETDYRKLLFRIFGKHRKFFYVIVISLLIALAIQFLQPFITSSIVDLGIAKNNLTLIYYLLGAQLFLLLSKYLFSIQKGWVTLYLSTRVNYSLLSGYLIKTLKLPIFYFESKRIGDFLQRINDQQRIESFITKTSVTIFFATFNVLVYSIVLYIFKPAFLLFFFISVGLYAGWSVIFLNRRKELDWARFEASSKNQSFLIQMFNGINDLKLNQAELYYHSNWKIVQKDIIENTFKWYRLVQLQDNVANLIVELTQMVITFYSAILVLHEKLTIGEMLSVQFIMGQLISPIEQIISSINTAQEASISAGRLTEVWNQKDEASGFMSTSQSIREPSAIRFENVSFTYPGNYQKTLDNISFDVEKNTVTAVVGLSGSGKTSLLKLMLGYYLNYDGDIFVNHTNLKATNIKAWRSKCGAVMQENFIFNESIAHNIAMNDIFEESKVHEAIRLANLDEFVDGLSSGIHTLIGNEGKGLSQGQKQRVLIARAVYKNPEFIFLDEATNSLDADNEHVIINHLRNVFMDKTVFIIAHRLSTIQFADRIIVIKDGRIVQSGNHSALIGEPGEYRRLVQKQLSLGYEN